MSELTILIINLILSIVLSGTFLWIASKITSVSLLFKEALICVVASGIAGLIPILGLPLSFFVFFYLLRHYTSAAFWPDLILMTLISKLFSFILMFAFIKYFYS